MESKDNAFYDSDTINFATYSPQELNMARDNTTIWHELGHGVMDRLMGTRLNLADTGGLSGAPCSRPGQSLRVANGVLFIVFDPELFAGADHFLREVGDLAEAVRSCPRAEGVAEVVLPGDPERRERDRRRAGGIRLDEGTWGQLADVAVMLKVPLPTN